jgi:hypothetical protein
VASSRRSNSLTQLFLTPLFAPRRLQTYTNIEFLSKRWKKKEHNWVGGWEFHTVNWDWDEQMTKIILIEQEVTGEAV